MKEIGGLTAELREAEAKFHFLKPFDKVNDSDFPHLGGKATNLVRLRRVGLPVPNGYCLSNIAYEFYLQNNVLPDGLIAEIIQAKKLLGGKVAIRSSADCEDGEKLSMAGVFQSHYVYDDSKVTEAVEQIFAQAHSEEVDQFMMMHSKSAKDIKMGLVIQELIEPEIAGVVYTGVNNGGILVQYVDGFGANLVDGKTLGSAILIGGDKTILESTGFEARPLALDTVQQLSDYAHVIEDLFQGQPQDIEFTYKDGTVHILQSRNLTADLGTVELEETSEDCLKATKLKLKKLVKHEKEDLGTQTAIFSDANYSELLPKPTEMDIGIYMYVWGGSDGVVGSKQAGHAEMGYLVGDEATEIISYIGGRVYSSIARYASIYHIGFPESRTEYFSTLVNEYLNAVQEDPEKGAYPQMGLFLQDPTLEDLKVRFGSKAEEYLQVYQAFAKQMHILAEGYLSQFQDKEFAEMTDFVNLKKMVNLEGLTNELLLAHGMGILEHLRTKSYISFVKAARLGFYYSQRLQDLLQQRLGMGKDKAQQTYSRLNQGLDGSLVTYANTRIAEADSEEEALSLAGQLVGHFSTGEMLEIRHKPLRDDPEALLRYVQGIRQAGDYAEQFQRQKENRLAAQKSLLESVPTEERAEFEAVLKASQTYMALRETVKHLYTMEYLLLRDALEVLASRLGLAEGDIYFLYPRELPDLVANPNSFRHLIRSRQQSFIHYQELDLPHVIRESDIDAINLVTESEENFQKAQGKFLAEGASTQGAVVNLDEFKDLSDVEGIIKWYRTLDIPVILVATQMNLSHDPYIAQAQGLIIENAGIVAHGAQRARELGKGALAGIRSKQLKTGMRVLFDPANRLVRRIE